MANDKQKQSERHFVETTANLLGLNWEIIDQKERPDFIIDQNGNKFGLEVTEIFNGQKTPKGSAKQKQQEAHRFSQLQSLRQSYENKTGVKLYLRFLRSPTNNIQGNISDIELNQIEEALQIENFQEKEWGFGKMLGLPSGGKIQITIYRYSNWIIINDEVGFVLQSPTDKIQASINEKSTKLEKYIERAGKDIRLLIIANRLNNSGKIRIADNNDDVSQINKRGFSNIYFLSYPYEANCL
ncbi:hypothetical protein [Thalassospira lucentensis]|uniref:hypothetical protein n=1 Tax=Thalassospira lucentensis TaxID=168935 RepID=UPI0003B6D1F2|nr:hypothetical protein [Thalassospira lucentensis]RCK29489.1 hypothetical protein TH1_06025 [Thalassospira lucentensis MCCC 1A00383 = DSM 14000]